MSVKPVVTNELLQAVASAFEKCLESSLEPAIVGQTKGTYYMRAADLAPKLFRQELGLEAREAYDYRPNPRPRTEAALRKLLHTADGSVKDFIEGELGIPNGPQGSGVVRTAIFRATDAAREEVTRQIEQAKATRKRPFRSPDEVSANKADAFAVRIAKATERHRR